MLHGWQKCALNCPPTAHADLRRPHAAALPLPFNLASDRPLRRSLHSTATLYRSLWRARGCWRASSRPSPARWPSCARPRSCGWTVSRRSGSGLPPAARRPAAPSCRRLPPASHRCLLPASATSRGATLAAIPPCPDTTRALYAQDVEAIEATVRALEHRLRDIRASLAREAAAIPQARWHFPLQSREVQHLS